LVLVPTVGSFIGAIVAGTKVPFGGFHFTGFGVTQDLGGQNMLEVCIPWSIEPIDEENPQHAEN
jgi:hypothetical protein